SARHGRPTGAFLLSPPVASPAALAHRPRRLRLGGDLPPSRRARQQPVARTERGRWGGHQWTRSGGHRSAARLFHSTPPRLATSATAVARHALAAQPARACARCLWWGVSGAPATHLTPAWRPADPRRGCPSHSLERDRQPSHLCRGLDHLGAYGGGGG